MPTTQELKLDPGPQRRQRSKFSCKRLLWTIVVIVCLALTYVVYLILRNVTNWIRAPHSHLFQDLTVPYKRNEVVRPLIDSNATFDIVATVWLRQNELRPALEDTNTTKGPMLVEDAIYSDTIFRGLHLKDKGVKTTVNLSVPTQIFKNAELWNYDLRASFVLVPSSPSPLMFSVNYSSWIPSTLYFPPMRVWS
ncbi:hypothetical protein HYPSUDRAFT_144309 [Hypholoma sublateritium FD-334 SS-4]|uniref:Uncharacterized protein n=1 Tax=Hypholoma sublateritium (strain FD-334 SS-4) TaxID=945553 RepID=A0A0D2NJ40_HYPSF|nr:hypothetical protein HYPSUDRAFT_144309 [Hypholoma sublateritium FD-334 SS-4]